MRILPAGLLRLLRLWVALYYMPLPVAVGGPLLKQRTSSPSCGDIEVRLKLAVTILLVIQADTTSSPVLVLCGAD